MTVTNLTVFENLKILTVRNIFETEFLKNNG